jgi:hypothetical protein
MKRKTVKPSMSLMVNSGSDYSIQDAAGRIYTPEEAKDAWRSGKVTDYNLAFQRLIFFGFDVEALKAHYTAGKR